MAFKEKIDEIKIFETLFQFKHFLNLGFKSLKCWFTNDYALEFVIRLNFQRHMTCHDRLVETRCTVDR